MKKYIGIAICGILLFLTIMSYKRAASVIDITPFCELASGPLVSVGVPANEVDCCLQWAFGDDVSELQVNELDDRWRERHSDLFIVEGTDDLWESTRKIGRAYLERVR